MITTIHHDDNSSDGKHSGGTVDKWCALSQSAFFVTLTLCYSFSYFSMYQNMYFFSCQKKSLTHCFSYFSKYQTLYFFSRQKKIHAHTQRWLTLCSCFSYLFLYQNMFFLSCQKNSRSHYAPLFHIPPYIKICLSLVVKKNSLSHYAPVFSSNKSSYRNSGLLLVRNCVRF